uniref:kelch-like protein 24 n=1 Tax=Styela clava TaxID=7725 RepID=UPI001939F880|nr:kelch-like protein 24 [Styela clava]
MSENPIETPSSENDTESQKDLRDAGVPTDFIINVGEQSFNVHRDLIMTKSEYFRAMLSHDTKENQQGFVDMNDVNPSVVGQCIEFMYTGETSEVSVNIEIIEDVLQTVELMHLQTLKDYCVEFLNENLRDFTCLQISLIAKQFSITELEENILSILQETYNVKDASELLEMPKSDFAEYIQSTNFSANMITWECFIRWIDHDVEHRSPFIFELYNQLNWKDFPSSKFLEAV